MRLQHINLGRGKDKVTEDTVHALFEIEVVERILRSGPVQMGVDTEHLAEIVADIDRTREEALSFQPSTDQPLTTDACS